jgi:hypothetical protein
MGTLADWSRDLRHAADTVLDEGEKVVKKGAGNVKDEARDRVRGYAHLPHYPSSITYDVHRGAHEVSAQIGPDKDRRQGPLGNIIEYGTVNNAPIPHLGPALDVEEPRFARAVADLGEHLLDER